MVSYMVQENHQEELNVIVCQVIMLPYFLSVNMKDPVEQNVQHWYKNFKFTVRSNIELGAKLTCVWNGKC